MTKKLSGLIVIVRGAGEVASGVAYGLHRSGLKVCLTETARPVAVTRGTTFSEAVYDGAKTIMGVTARLAAVSPEAIKEGWQQGDIPLIVDPGLAIKDRLKPDILVDGIMAKRPTGIKITDAPLVIGLGPGFYAGRDVHVVIETNHSENLGKVIFEGEAEENTGIPVTIGGLNRERVIWADRAGIFSTDREIGDKVTAGEVIARIDGTPVKAPLSGMLRGLLRSGVKVSEGSKLIEVDQVNDSRICYFIADKIRVIADGVLNAIKLRYSPGLEDRNEGNL